MVIILVLVAIVGALYGLYTLRGSVKKSSTQAATPRHAESSSQSVGTDTILGVGIACSLDEVLNEYGNTTGWRVTIEGTNIDAAKKSTGVKIHVPWGTSIEGQDVARGVHQFDGPAVPSVVASAETFAIAGFGGSLTSCTVTIGEEPTPTPTPTPADRPPVGSLDAVNCTSIVGWAFDMDQPQTVLDVHVYRDGPAGSGGVFVGAYKADRDRPDVNQAYGVSGAHGYDIPTPPGFADGAAHTVYVYVINPVSGKTNPLLTGSPKSLTCPGTTTACSLSVQKQVNKTTAQVGDEIQYTVDVKNTGTAACTGPVKVVDVYDASLAYVRESHSSGVERGYGNEQFHVVNTRTLTWSAGTLAPGQSAQVVWYGQVGAAMGCGGGSIPNRAQATAREYSNLTSWAYSPTVSVTVPNTCTTNQQTDVGVQKTVSPSLVSVGQSATFTVKVKNYGPLPATAVSLKDTLPQGVTLTGFVAGQGSFSESGMLWTVGGLAVGAEASLTLTVRGDTVGSKVNTVSIVGVTPQDQNAGNNQASATLTVTAPEVPPVVCAPGTQTVTVGQVAAFAAVGGTGAYVWSAPDGSPTAGAGSGFTTQFNSVGAKTVTVASGERSVTCAVTVQAGGGTYLDLAITKQVSPAVIQVGQSAVFTIHISNRTSVGATGVRVTDALPAGLTLIGQTASVGSYTSASNIWEVGALPAGSSASLTLQVTGSQVGTFVNRADVSGSTPVDSDTSNNSATASLVVESGSGGGSPLACGLTQNQVVAGTTVTAYASGGNGVYSWAVTGGSPAQGSGTVFTALLDHAGSYVFTLTSGGTVAQCTVLATATTTGTADLSLAKNVSPAHVSAGGQAIFTLTLQNSGPNLASLVSVRDVLPAGLTFVAATTGRGSFDAGAGVWTVGELQPGEQVTLLITVKVPRSGTFTNTAEVWTSNVPDPDSTPGNDNPSEDDRATATVKASEGLAAAGIPLGPVSVFMILCVIAALAAIRVKTVRRVRLHTPVGRVAVGFDEEA